ncbi:enoyl-CoA hydratase/isomerase family protein [bacterium]|nr:enoyl-CoA hydratase/isomerase family protein [bacterium]
MPDYQYLSLLHEPSTGLATLSLQRPELKNAFNAGMVKELQQCFAFLAGMAPEELRLVLIQGAGGYFCSGGDLNWMREQKDAGAEQNLADAQALAQMLQQVDSCPVPLLALVQGGAFGGGLGLLCCCDHVLAEDGALYSFSEVRLGIAPATILPYVLRRLGFSACTRLLLSGERFGNDLALRCGLVQESAAPADLEDSLRLRISSLLAAGPRAARETKALLRRLAGGAADEAALNETAALIARLRVSPEGQEGLSAFLEKRRPAWLPQD